MSPIIPPRAILNPEYAKAKPVGLLMNTMGRPTPEARRIMSGATNDEEYHLWLEALAATCTAAPSERPCAGCQQGGVCDSQPAADLIRQDRDEWDSRMT